MDDSLDFHRAAVFPEVPVSTVHPFSGTVRLQPTTCQGTVTNNRGERWTYTSSSSGNVIAFIYDKNDGVFAMYPFRLKTV